MSILSYATPPQKLYAEDRKVLEDYQAGADAYNARVNAYNKELADYKSQLEAYQKQAEAYNAAAEAWNATDRTRPFEEFSGYVARPQEFTATAPTKPTDPGFSAGDVEGYMKEAEGRALRRAKAAAAAQQIMTAPGQFYIAGRENFGVQPEVSLAGMSGFGSSAIGFQEGGMVPGLPFASSILGPGIGPTTQAVGEEDGFGEMPSGPLTRAIGEEGSMVNIGKLPADLSARPVMGRPLAVTQAVGEDGMGGNEINPLKRPEGGIGNLFQLNTQIANLQGSPLQNYQDYLMNTYGEQAMNNMEQAITDDIGGFVQNVDQAEKAHFGADETYGFGGGAYHNSLLEQLPPPNGGQPTQLFENGGAVTQITEDDLLTMRNKVINDYGFDPVDIALQEGVDPELFLKVMWTENRGRQGPVSNAGAIGLMQLMPGTAAELGVDPNDPVQNARGGARYLRAQLDTFGTVPLALAAYNAGPTRVREYGGVPPFDETRNYVAQIYGVDVGEILPGMDQFFQMTPGADPSPMPRPRPTGLGTEGYVPEQPVASEYLMQGLGSVFPQPRPRPYIPNIMQQQQPVQEEARGIEFYRQYAALQPEDQRSQSLASSPST